MDQASSWPGVVANALDKLPVEHFVSVFWVLLGVALVTGVLAFIPKLLRPAQSASETADAVAKGVREAEVAEAVARGVRKAINGDFEQVNRRLDKQDDHFNRRLDQLAEQLRQSRETDDQRHRENLERFGRYERFVVRPEPPWDGTPESDRRKTRR